jgi:hypothetical protein
MSKPSLPNLIIAGVNKAGTTSTFTYLSSHPQICITRKKETCYFLPVRYGKQILPLSEYEKFFLHCNGQKYIMESTPGYFYGGQKLAREIKQVLGSIRIIIVFRDPVDRLFSFYKSQKSKTELNREINFIDYVRQCERLGKDKSGYQEFNKYSGVMGGFYAHYLDDWFDIFGPKNVKVLFFDDLCSDTGLFLEGICQWLDIDSHIYDSGSFSAENISVQYKNRPLHKMALRLNKSIERFSRRYPSVKRKARSLYHQINVRGFEEEITDQEREYLVNLYEESNQALALTLRGKGYYRLPAWLG